MPRFSVCLTGFCTCLLELLAVPQLLCVARGAMVAFVVLAQPNAVRGAPHRCCFCSQHC